ncbi:hypothetical protein ACQ7HM_18785 [Williamsia sp. MIQD14]|uniref:hypothetical protein n=1 Tax=Williamsia sp. MIQD14 TaxID=3425703 RepID=UPI003DA09BC3
MMAQNRRFGPGVAIGYGATALAAVLLFLGLITSTTWLWVLALVLFVLTGLWWGGIRRQLFPHEGRSRNR